MIYLIVGRTATGKDTFAKILEEYDLKVVKSRTTRPKRDANDDSHIFVKDVEDGALAKNTICGYDYYILPEDLESKDVYIVDPKGAFDIARAMPNTAFVVAFIDADYEVRKDAYLKRNLHATDEDFEERNSFEDADMTKMVDSIRSDKSISKCNWPGNIVLATYISNNHKNKITLAAKAAAIAGTKSAADNTKAVIEIAIKAGVLEENPKNSSEILGKTNEGKITATSKDIMSVDLTQNTDFLGSLIQEIIHDDPQKLFKKWLLKNFDAVDMPHKDHTTDEISEDSSSKLS
jgi:hypothetical protein